MIWLPQVEVHACVIRVFLFQRLKVKLSIDHVMSICEVTLKTHRNPSLGVVSRLSLHLLGSKIVRVLRLLLEDPA
jgi:hypothetical protein